MRDDFAVFILSHGRADRVDTMKALEKCGYTGKTYIILDNIDDQEDEYKKLYGAENIIVFDKEEAAKGCDTMDNWGKRNVVVFARNTCHKIARELGLKYFLELDDDYTSFDFRYHEGEKLAAKVVPNLDRLIDDMIEFLEASGAMVIALSQGGDYMGGVNGRYYWKMLSRKAMNAFFCKTDMPFKFLGTINEDTNMYITYGSRGEKIFSVTQASIIQRETQSNAGGLTDIYLDVGTYVKSFYSVMCMPSCVKVAMMGQSHRRMHHNINWAHCVPLILSDKYRKE